MGNGQIATFNYPHNYSKTRVLIALYQLKYKRHNAVGLSTRELHDITGVPLSYLWFRLPDWCEWRYIRRVHSTKDYLAWFGYKIDKRGERFLLDRVPDEVITDCFSLMRRQL